MGTETNLNEVNNMLVDLFSYLSANEQFAEQIRADKATDVTRRVQSPSLTRAIPGTSKRHTCRRQVSAEPRQAVPEAMVEIAEAVRANVTSRMRSTPATDLIISDEEEAIPVHRKRGLKSAKLRTADT